MRDSSQLNFIQIQILLMRNSLSLLLFFLFCSSVLSQCDPQRCLECADNLCSTCRDQYLNIEGNCEIRNRQQNFISFDGIGGQLNRISIIQESSFGGIGQNRANSGTTGSTSNSQSNLRIIQLQQPITIKGCQFQRQQVCILCSDGYKLNPMAMCESMENKCQNINIDQFTCSDCLPTLSLNNQVDCLDKKCEEGKWNYYFCQKCANGFVVNQQGICLDQNCISYNKGLCSQCRINFSIDQNSPINLCMRTFPDHCLQNDDENPLECELCEPGFYVQENLCVSLCLEKDGDNNCISCMEQSQLLNGVCFFNNSFYCQIFDNEERKCKRCLPQYTLNQNGGCQMIKQMIIIERADLSCLKFDSSEQKCLQCFSGFYLQMESGRCILGSSTTCLTFEDIGGNCTSCPVGMDLILSEGMIICSTRVTDEVKGNSMLKNCQSYNSIQMTCVKCIDRYYPSTDGKSCKAVSNTCNRYRETDGSCIDCIIGYRKIDGVCKQPALGIDKPCTSYDKNLICQSCAQGFELKNFVCVKI